MRGPNSVESTAFYRRVDHRRPFILLDREFVTNWPQSCVLQRSSTRLRSPQTHLYHAQTRHGLAGDVPGATTAGTGILSVRQGILHGNLPFRDAEMLGRLFWIRTIASIGAIALLLMFGLAGCNKAGSKTGQVEETDPDLIVPDGNPAKILEFIKRLREKKQSGKPDFDRILREQRALVRAGEKILNLKADDETLREGAIVKLMATMTIAANPMNEESQRESLAKEAVKTVDQLRQDQRKVVSGVANEFWIPVRALSLKSMSSEERKTLTAEAMTQLVNSKASQQSVGDAAFLAEQFQSIEDIESAADIFDKMAQEFAKSDDEKLRGYKSTLEGQATRLRLPGNTMELSGKLLTGGELDWSSYRGKVVLVDFWATWCGPCVAELPNVKANYARFHNRGFEVVAISLDNDRAQLKQFVDRQKLPWIQVFDDTDKEQLGWKAPLATKYGVSSIPAAFLVDKDGKVVSTAARGPELEQLLIKLLGS